MGMKDRKAEQAHYKNGILSRLPDIEVQVFSRDLEPVSLPRRFILSAHGSTVDYVYFLECGFGSVICAAPDGKKLQVAMFGPEAFAPIAVTSTFHQCMYDCVMLADGAGYRIRNSSLRKAVQLCPLLNELLILSTLNLASQASFTALSAASRSFESRLARLLLMS